MIPLIRPMKWKRGLAEQYFLDSYDTGMLSNFGQAYEKLKEKLRVITGLHCVPLQSGTAAIEMALVAAGLERGDRVFLPDFTHVGTLLAVLKAGMKPVLVGVDPKTWIPDPKVIRENLEYIDGLIIVSPFGYDCNVAQWDQEAAGKLRLAYDFAGAYGHFPITPAPIAYSFHATKNFGVGEGGMLATGNPGTADQVRRLSNFDTMPNRQIGSLKGGNYKIDEIKAAHLLAALQEHASVIDRISTKLDTLAFYAEQIPGAYIPAGQHFPSMCVLGNLPASDLEAASEREGITFKRYYPLLSEMPGLEAIEAFSTSPPEMRNCVALPSDVTLREAKRVVECVRKYL